MTAVDTHARTVTRFFGEAARGQLAAARELAIDRPTWFGRELDSESWTSVATLLADKSADVSRVQPLPPALLRGLSPTASREFLAELAFEAGDEIQIVDLQLSTKPVSVFVVLRAGLIRGVFDVESFRNGVRSSAGTEETTPSNSFRGGPLARTTLNACG